ncbi:MAG TPA: hypothetical protein VIJ22_09815, partial [Polyangiaceae bacterium]
ALAVAAAPDAAAAATTPKDTAAAAPATSPDTGGAAVTVTVRPKHSLAPFLFAAGAVGAVALVTQWIAHSRGAP